MPKANSKGRYARRPIGETIEIWVGMDMVNRRDRDLRLQIVLYLNEGHGFPNIVLLPFKWWLGRTPSTLPSGGNLFGGSVTSMCGARVMIAKGWSGQYQGCLSGVSVALSGLRVFPGQDVSVRRSARPHRHRRFVSAGRWPPTHARRRHESVQA